MSIKEASSILLPVIPLPFHNPSLIFFWAMHLLRQSVSVHQYSIELRGLEIYNSKDGITNPDQ